MNLKRLATTNIAASATAVYTADGVTTRIDAVTLTNTHTSAVTVSLWLPAGGSAGSSSIVLQAKSIAAGASYTVKELAGHVLEDGYSLSASASTGGVVAIVVSGIEVAVEAEEEEEA